MILHGAAPDSRLDVEENELSRRAEALAAAAEMVKVEIQRTEAEQTRLRDEVEQRRRAEVAAEVLKHAEAIDSLFAQAAMHLAALDQSDGVLQPVASIISASITPLRRIISVITSAFLLACA